MTLLIIVLLLTLIALFAQLGSNYYTQIRVIRRFFKHKGEAPEEARNRTSLVENIDYGSVFHNGKLDLYTANDASGSTPVLVWVHGGGFVGGDKSDAEPWARVIAAKLKIAVVSINYCLAPEQHYPGPLVQLTEALYFLREKADSFGLDMSRLFFAGDSAGAQIASQYAALIFNESLRDQVNLKPPVAPDELKGIVLCCGVYNMDTAIKSRFPAIRTFMWAYTNEKKLKKFARKDEMSTVMQLGEGYCPVFLTCGNADPLLGQTNELLHALIEANIEHVAFLPKEKGKKLGHEYQFLVGTQEADEALEKAVAFIEKHL